MFEKVLETATGKVGERLVATAGPAIVFWSGGAICWWLGSYGQSSREFIGWLPRQSVAVQGAIAVLLAVLILGSATLVRRLDILTLRLLAGFWPKSLRVLRDFSVGRIEDQAANERRRMQDLEAARVDTRASSADLAELQRLDLRRRQRPTRTEQLMPTRIGNLLVAAESKPAEKYGLDSNVLWPRLWLILPCRSQREIASVRLALDAVVAACTWGILFAFFAPLTIFAVPIGLLVAILSATLWVPGKVTSFGDMIESAFDLHRRDLYLRLRWPLPSSPGDEIGQGRRLTSYVLRGSDRTDIALTDKEAPRWWNEL